MENKPICYVPNREIPEVFSGVPSFLGLPVIKTKEDLENSDIVILGVPWEGVNTNGPFTSVEMGTKTIIVGYNFHFGAERKGDINFLQKNSVKYGYNLILMPPQKKYGEIINSTKIRLFLKEGELSKVTDFLGRTFSIEGKVIHGDKIGGKLGFPTANLQLFINIKISEGVYAGFVKHNNKLYSSAIYIGNSPTFDKNERKFEVYLFDVEKNLYDETLRVYLTQKVRNIKIFENASQLKTQIYSDIEKIKHITEPNKIIG